MHTIFAFVVSFVAVAAAAPSHSERIIGGGQASINQYPYMSALLYAVDSSLYRHFCGGSIISTRSILSAAHCVDAGDTPKLRLRVGSSYKYSGGVIYAVETVFSHPEHNIPYLDNDVAILRTLTSIVYDTVIQPATIAGANYILPDNDVVWSVGWGDTTLLGSPSEEVRHAQVWVINQEICTQSYALIGYGVTANMFCTGWQGIGGRGQCNGDFGGPIVHNGVVVGIAAWSQECALGLFPAVNMRTSRYIDWILTNANENLET